MFGCCIFQMISDALACVYACRQNAKLSNCIKVLYVVSHVEPHQHLNKISISKSHCSQVQMCFWGKIYSKWPWRNPQEKSQYRLIFACTLSATTAWILIMDASGQTVVFINIIRFITFRAVPVAPFLPGWQVLPSCHCSSFLTSHSGWSTSDPRTCESRWWFRFFMGQNHIFAQRMNHLCVWWATCQLI